jgi:hypothetical protein
MVLVEPSTQDVLALKEAAKSKFLTDWFEKCEHVHPGCQREWSEKVMPLVY